MKSTELLIVTTDFKIKDSIIIHPNDGYDIGLFNNKYIKKIYTPGEKIFDNNYIENEVILSNECKNGSIQISNNFWIKIGKPPKIKLSINEDKIYISCS